MSLRHSGGTVLAVILGIASALAAQTSLEYPGWRGPNRDGSASGFVRPASWPDRMTMKWRTDVASGKVVWLGEAREAENTAFVKAGEVLFLLHDDGELIVADAKPSGIAPVKRYTVSESATWAQPAISGDRVFVKDARTLALWTWTP